MLNNRISATVCLFMAFVALPAYAQDQGLVETAKQVQQKYAKGVISVNAIAKLQPKLGGKTISEQEQKLNILATVIDPSGLAITSLTNLYPSNALPKIQIKQGDVAQSLEIGCDVRGITYRLDDDTEVPVRIVFKDEDLDLAFLSPEKPLDDATKGKLSVIPLEGDERTVAILDSYINLGRMGKSFDYVPTVQLARISAIVTKPRMHYFGDQSSLGTPAFDNKGRFLGLSVRYTGGAKEEVEGLESLLKMSQASSGDNNTLLPAAEIVKLVPQAKLEANKAEAAD